MDTATLVALITLIISVLVLLATGIWWMRGMAKTVEANTQAIRDLAAKMVSHEHLNSITEHLKRHDAMHAATEGKFETFGQQFHGRIDRYATRLDKMEGEHSQQNSATAAMLAQIKSTVEALQKSVDRLERLVDESARNHSPREFDQLQTFLQFQRLLKEAK